MTLTRIFLSFFFVIFLSFFCAESVLQTAELSTFVYSGIQKSPSVSKAVEIYSYISTSNSLKTSSYDQKTNQQEASKRPSSTKISEYESLNFAELYPGISVHNTTEESYTALFKKVLTLMPTHRMQSLKNVILKHDTEDPYRGLGGTKTIIINTANISSNQEFSSVLVHELCHIADLGGIQGTKGSSVSDFEDGSNAIYSNDPSVAFYSISWEHNTKKHFSSKKSDFVSGYASTDPFEDLAETCAYYVLHNKNFQRRAKYNTAIQEKYNWVSSFIFDGNVFESGTDIREAHEVARPWDVTILPYNYRAFIEQDVFQTAGVFNASEE